jgi:hypothetical protein
VSEPRDPTGLGSCRSFGALITQLNSIKLVRTENVNSEFYIITRATNRVPLSQIVWCVRHVSEKTFIPRAVKVWAPCNAVLSHHHINVFDARKIAPCESPMYRTIISAINPPFICVASLHELYRVGAAQILHFMNVFYRHLNREITDMSSVVYVTLGAVSCQFRQGALAVVSIRVHVIEHILQDI